MASRFTPEPYPKPPPYHLKSDMWGKISPEVTAREGIFQTPGAETHFIPTVLGKRLAVEVMGNPDGYPIIFQPGTPPVMPEAVPEGAKVISVYRAGYGFSCAESGRGVEHGVSNLLNITRYFGLRKIALAARSGGTGFCLDAAATAHKLGLIVESCAVVVPAAPYTIMGELFFTGMGELNTKIFRALFADTEDYQLPFNPKDRPILSATPVTSSTQYTYSHLSSLRAETILLTERYFDELAVDTTKDTGARKQYAAAHAAALRFGNQGRLDDLRSNRHWDINFSDICVPTLIWSAESDQFTPVGHAKKLAECIGSAAALHIQPNATHHDGVNATTQAFEWSLQHAS